MADARWSLAGVCILPRPRGAYAASAEMAAVGDDGGETPGVARDRIRGWENDDTQTLPKLPVGWVKAEVETAGETAPQGNHERRHDMLTMKQARKEYAGREMVSHAFTDKESGKEHRRVNRRTVRPVPFKAWARANYTACAHVSPKLARILRGPLAAVAA